MLKLDIQLFAVPFRKVSKTRKRMRRTHYKLEANGMIKCPKCGADIRPHRACPDCGFYKGEKVVEIEESVLVDQNCAICVEAVEEKWGNLLMTIKPFNHSVEAFLRASRPKSIKGKTLLLEVFYPFHKDRLEEAKNRKIVEECMTKVFGIDLCFECVLGKNKKEPLVIKNDTPMEHVSDQLVENKNDKAGGGDIYDVAKEIFG
jgi:large subunit ribosomal protein L32